MSYLALAGAAIQGIQAQQAAEYNAKVAKQQQAVAVNQSNAQEGLVRRSTREVIGRQAAAFGGANVGYDGSSETALDQSAVNAELDALNTRYKGAITGWGYGAQAQVDQWEGKQAVATALLAGASAMAKGSSYSFAPQSPMQMSGLASPQPASGLGG